MADALSLTEHFAVLGADLRAETVEVTDTLWQDIDERFGSFEGASLLSTFHFESAWPTWEMHPAGDEIVYLLAGDTDMVLATPKGEDTIRLTQAGHYLIVPKGTWHTARPHSPTTMLFITPGQGTENREQLPWEDGDA